MVYVCAVLIPGSFRKAILPQARTHQYGSPNKPLMAAGEEQSTASMIPSRLQDPGWVNRTPYVVHLRSISQIFLKTPMGFASLRIYIPTSFKDLYASSLLQHHLYPLPTSFKEGPPVAPSGRLGHPQMKAAERSATDLHLAFLHPNPREAAGEILRST